MIWLVPCLFIHFYYCRRSQQSPRASLVSVGDIHKSNFPLQIIESSKKIKRREKSSVNFPRFNSHVYMPSRLSSWKLWSIKKKYIYIYIYCITYFAFGWYELWLLLWWSTSCEVLTKMTIKQKWDVHYWHWVLSF